MFLYEKELKEQFWASYNKNGRAKRWQFECPIRLGNADLITIEYYDKSQSYQINGFEFKINDLKKAFLQAEHNMPYCNKSWVVVPIEKKDIIEKNYIQYLKKQKCIGVMGVHPGGMYEIIYQPYFKKEVLLSQEILNICMIST